MAISSRVVSGKAVNDSPNRVQPEFTAVKHNQVWVADITYLSTWQGWLYPGYGYRLFCP